MGRRRRSSTPSADAVFSGPLTRPTRLLSDVAVPSAHYPSVEDLRTYHPLDMFRPLMTVEARPDVNVNVKRPSKSGRFLPFGLQFEAPQKVLVCVRRKRRKEVLHALKKVGRGGSSRRRRRRGPHSQISC